MGYYADDSIHMLQEYDHVPTCPCWYSIRVWLNLDTVDSIDVITFYWYDMDARGDID
jgi:hypothetical protein